MSKFWLTDVSQLFASAQFIPRSTQSIADQLNAASRLVFAIATALAIIKPALGLGFLTVGLGIIIGIFYYVTTNPMNAVVREGFVDEIEATPIVAFAPTARRFCNDSIPLTFDCDTSSANNALLGKANPKTKIPPIVAPPSHELDFWRVNDLTTHSATNARTNFDAFGSGYDAGGGDRVVVYPKKCEECAYVPCMCDRSSRRSRVATQTIQPGVYQTSRFDEPINANIGISLQKQFDPMLIESSPGRVMYEALDGKAKNAFVTGYIGERPDVVVSGPEYGRAETIDDLLRNNAKISRVPLDEFQSESNVFDPRFTGYGPPDRGYVDSVTGQPRFFYDDVSAVTMPNFIARNNVDAFPWATQYGTDVGTKYGDEYRRSANDAFLDASIKFRVELQERLLRKRNAEMWQLRVAPITTMSR